MDSKLYEGAIVGIIIILLIIFIKEYVFETYDFGNFLDGSRYLIFICLALVLLVLLVYRFRPGMALTSDAGTAPTAPAVAPASGERTAPPASRPRSKAPSSCRTSSGLMPCPSDRPGP